MEVERLEAAEQYKEALALAEKQQKPSEPATVLAYVRAAKRIGKLGVDDAILELEAIIDELDDAQRQQAHAMMLECYARKRLFSLVDDYWQDLQDKGQALPLVAYGKSLMAQDERDRAKKVFDQALTIDAACLTAVLARADWDYVVGDFAQAKSRLAAFDGMEDEPEWGGGMRLRAALLNTEGHYAEEIATWHKIVAARPKSDKASNDSLSLAYAHSANGDYDAAEKVLSEVWHKCPDEPIGRHARRRLDHLQDPKLKDANVKRLDGFPTIAQKHNYCGPAVLELCFRFLGLTFTQDEIADVVKTGEGTPMCEITSFLQRHDIVARRIEANAQAIKTCIDLGLPVITQEEYSMWSHVAVITGYDERMGMFISQDPDTHRPTLSPNEWLDSVGDLFGNGGIVVLGRRGIATSETARALDAAGIYDAKHLQVMDGIDRQRYKAQENDDGRLTPGELIEHCSKVTELMPTYKHAWYRLLAAHFQQALQTKNAEARRGFLKTLYFTRARYPVEEWPHQYHGHFLFNMGRYFESYAEYLRAHRVDKHDANNVANMGDCMLEVGEYGRAESFMKEALLLHPEHHGAASQLASLYCKMIEADAVVERQGWLPEDPKPTITNPPKLPVHELHRRADHFLKIANAASPDSPANIQTKARLLRARGLLVEATSAFEQLLDKTGAPSVRLRLIHLLLWQGETHAALAQAEKLVGQTPGFALAWLAAAEATKRCSLDDDDDRDAVADALRAGLIHCDDNHELLMSALYEWLSDQDSGESAATQIAEFVDGYRGNIALLECACEKLDEENHRGMALKLWRMMCDEQPGNLQAHFRLGALLSEDVLTRDEGKQLLEKVLEHAPDVAVVRHRLAWLYLDDEPKKGLEVISPVLDEEDALVCEAACALHGRLGHIEMAAHYRKQALAVADPDSIKGLSWLVGYHNHHDRYDTAIELASQLPHEALAENAAARASFLSAYMHAGRAKEILPLMKEMFSGDMPLDVAWRAYYAYRSVDYEFAALAADVVAESEEDQNEKLEWQINAAGMRAKQGEHGPLEEIVSQIGDSAIGWANAYWAFDAVERKDDALKSADKAYELGPSELQVLSAAQEAALDRKNVELAIELAQKALELHPYQHVGNERLALLYAQLGRVDQAIPHAQRAVDLAPFCHISQRAQAVTLFMAGKFDDALIHAERCLGLEPPEEEDEGNSALMIKRAIASDTAGLKRCIDNLKSRAPLDNFPHFYSRLRDLAART